MNYGIYTQEETIGAIFQKDKCDPTKFNVTYCSDYKTKQCPMTCEYAKTLERKVNEAKIKQTKSN